MIRLINLNFCIAAVEQVEEGEAQIASGDGAASTASGAANIAAGTQRLASLKAAATPDTCKSCDKEEKEGFLYAPVIYGPTSGGKYFSNLNNSINDNI